MEGIKTIFDEYAETREAALMKAAVRDEATEVGMKKLFSDVYGVSLEYQTNDFVFSRISADTVWEFADYLVTNARYNACKIPPMVSESAFAIAMIDAGLFDDAFRIYQEWKDKG